MQRKKGFTLIELLVAISIIAIIATIAFVSYSQAQKLARDARRKQDLRSIAQALELYYQKNNGYPNIFGASSPGQSLLSFWNSLGTALVPNYINNLPSDPINKFNSQSDHYEYAYTSTGGSCPVGASSMCGFELYTTLENDSDPEVNYSKTSNPFLARTGYNFQIKSP